MPAFNGYRGNGAQAHLNSPPQPFSPPLPQTSLFTAVSQSPRLLLFCSSVVLACARAFSSDSSRLLMPLPIKMLVMEVNIDRRQARGLEVNIYACPTLPISSFVRSAPQQSYGSTDAANRHHHPLHSPPPRHQHYHQLQQQQFFSPMQQQTGFAGSTPHRQVHLHHQVPQKDLPTAVPVQAQNQRLRQQQQPQQPQQNGRTVQLQEGLQATLRLHEMSTEL